MVRQGTFTPWNERTATPLFWMRFTFTMSAACPNAIDLAVSRLFGRTTGLSRRCSWTIFRKLSLILLRSAAIAVRVVHRRVPTGQTLVTSGAMLRWSFLFEHTKYV